MNDDIPFTVKWAIGLDITPLDFVRGIRERRSPTPQRDKSDYHKERNQ